MMASVLIVTVFLLLVWGVERNHRQPGRPRWVNRDVVGSADVADRDWARIVADLRATDRGQSRSTPGVSRRRLRVSRILSACFSSSDQSRAS